MSKFKMTVSVPVRPHVKQYLEQNLFFKSKEFILTSTSLVGSYLMEMLEPKRKANFPLRYNPENIITVILTDNYNFIARPYVSKSKAHKFNLFVERKIKEEMYVFIECLTSYNVKNVNESIEAFRNKYSIRDEDMTFDKLKQAYYRYRRGLESRDSNAA